MKYSLFSKTTSKYFYFFFKNGIIAISEAICEEIQNKFEKNFKDFVTFSINKLWSKIERNKKRVLSKLSDFFNNYEEKCQVCENDS